MLRSRAVMLLAAVVAGGLFLAGLLLQGVTAALVLLVVAAGLVTLTRHTWPLLSSGQRVARAAIVAGVVAIAVVKLVNR
ncbi:MAG: hypothetical protein JO222_15880 [Frankiales bacterium]|nr:hypothetical protein [Frankiales bacterium]